MLICMLNYLIITTIQQIFNTKYNPITYNGMSNKARSKSKLKSSITFVKKQIDDKQKKMFKQIIKKNGEKENLQALAKFSMTTVHSKKKIKQNGEEDTSRSVSPLCMNNKKNQTKTEDQKFIQKLFSHQQDLKNKNKKCKNFLVQKLIQGLVPSQKLASKKSCHAPHHSQSTDLVKELHLKNQQVSQLQQQIQQLKLYVSNFTFKVFDLTVLCRKYSHMAGSEQENYQFSKRTDQVIAYLDSLIRQWKLEDKIKIHCQNISKRISLGPKSRIDDSRKRCHTQSLKIPIQQYLQSLQHTGSKKNSQKAQICVKNDKKQQFEDQNEQSEQIMKILSRRSSTAKNLKQNQKQEEQVYVVIRPYEGKNEHQLQLRAGQRISVLQKSANNRWLGVKDKEGKIGYFPKDCLF